MAIAKCELELPWGSPNTRLHCPVCGTETLGEVDVASCPHLVYVYLCDIGDFMWLADDLANDLQPAMEAEGEDLSPLEAIEQTLAASGSQSLVELSVTTKGMACGPVYSTVRACFDFAAEACLSE